MLEVFERIPGIAEHYFDNKRHRTNGPAWVDKDDGRFNMWYLGGYWHRYYGPADTSGGWAIHGKKIKQC